jgi:hypothetical protein
MLPGRTDNRIKNRFHSLIRNALIRKNLMSLPCSTTSCIKPATSCDRQSQSPLTIANSIKLRKDKHLQDIKEVTNYNSDEKGQTLSREGSFPQESYPSDSTSVQISPSKSYATTLRILNESTQKYMNYPSPNPSKTLGLSVYSGEEDHSYDEIDQGAEHELNGSELLQSLKGIPGLSRPKDQSEEIYFKKPRNEPQVQVYDCNSHAQISRSQSYKYSRNYNEYNVVSSGIELYPERK